MDDTCLLGLPYELWLDVWTNYTPSLKDICAWEQVCKSWAKLLHPKESNQVTHLWRAFHLRDFGGYPRPPLDPETDWKESYKRVVQRLRKKQVDEKLSPHFYSGDWGKAWRLRQAIKAGADKIVREMKLIKHLHNPAILRILQTAAQHG